MDIQIQEALGTPTKMNLRKLTPRHIIKFSKSKTMRNLRKQQKKSDFLYTRELLITLPVDFSTETLQARKK